MYLFNVARYRWTASSFRQLRSTHHVTDDLTVWQLCIHVLKLTWVVRICKICSYNCGTLHFRPPDIHVGGLIFTTDSFFLSFFIRNLISELSERNSTISGHMVESECNLKIHVRNLGYPFPLQIGDPKTTFLTISQLKGKFNGLYLRNKTRYTQADKCVANDKKSSTSSQNHMNLGSQTALNWMWVFAHPP